MFDQPIRRKQHLYPKDFTQAQNVLNPQAQKRKSSTGNEQFSFNGSKRNNGHIHRSTQLPVQSRQDLEHTQPMFTINPEQTTNIFTEQQKQSPLTNQHINRRRPYLNPDILSRPRIQQKVYYQIPQASQPQGDSCTPGSIKNNSKIIQKPLIQQAPVCIYPNYHKSSTKKVEEAHIIFQQALKSNNIHLSPGKTARKYTSSLGRCGQSEIQSSFRLSKKFSSPINVTARQSSIFTKNDSPNNKNIFSYGYLLEDKKVSKLKDNINQFIEERARNKSMRIHKQTQSDVHDIHGSGRTQHSFNPKLARTRKILSASRFFPELGHDFEKFHEQNQIQTEEGECEQYNSPAPFFQNQQRTDKHFVISYKSSLNSLKQILKSIAHGSQSGKKAQIQIRVPQVLLGLRLDMHMDKTTLYNTAMQLFQQLQIPPTNLNIKRYSNCVIMVAKSICVIYHYSLKVYLGGWQTMYLDQGVRHGLGLQWVPNKYVYYGQYVNNKREGLGVYKEPVSAYIGSFANGQKNSGYTVNSSGQIYKSGSNISQNVNQFYRDDYLQSEPIL